MSAEALPAAPSLDLLDGELELAAPPDARAADRIRRAELADFLRSRRERIAPEQVGLPPGGRRRTPGLRREEVAQLAGVGVAWYTWLEQGRDIRVSEQVLDAVGRTLLLDQQEVRHLHTLGGTSRPTLALECAAVSPRSLAILAQLSPFPAAVQNARFDVLAYNRTYARMVADLDVLPLEDRNLLWLTFTDPVWRERCLDWEDTVRRMVATFRAAMAEHVADPAWKATLRRLREGSAEFRELWAEHEVSGPELRTKRFVNPDVGLLTLEFTHMWLAPRAGGKLMVYTPADAETAVRLDRLAALTAEPSPS